MVDMLTVLRGILAGVLAVAFCKQRFKGWKLLRLLVAIARYTGLRGMNENKNKNKNKKKNKKVLQRAYLESFYLLEKSACNEGRAVSLSFMFSRCGK
jgi:hypothetical protein